MGVRHHARVFWAYTKLHLKTAMEYRMNFFAQSGFMLINDLLWIFIWYFLFSSFNAINGYTYADALLIFGISAMAYGFLAFFCGNNRHIWEIIAEGRLDFYLALPIDELFHALITKSKYDGLGDILFGIIVIHFMTPHSVWIGIAVALLGAVTLLGFMILSDSIAFWIEYPKATTRAANNLLLGFSSWPIDVYQSSVRAVLYIIPLAFIAAVPSSVLRSFSWSSFGWLALVASLVLLLGILVFKAGLRRYESGNVISTRT